MSLDLHHFFAGANSSKSPFTSSSSEQDEFSDVESLELDPPLKNSSANISKSSQRKYNKRWEKDFLWLEYDHNYEGAFCKICRRH